MAGRSVGQALARDPLDLAELAERLDGERPAGAREPARRQDVVGARGVVARATPGDQRPTKIEPALRIRATAASASATSIERCSGP